MLRWAGLVLLSAIATPAVGDAGCHALQQQIAAKIRAAGVASFSLVTVETQSEIPGTVVGRCAQGTRKIVYAPNAPSAAARPAGPGAAPATTSQPAAKVVSTERSDPILTECKDGSESIGGACKP